MVNLAHLKYTSITYFKQRRRLILVLVVTGLGLLLGPVTFTYVSTRSDRYDMTTVSVKEIPYHRVGLVLGAGILDDGTPTPYLKNRIATAVKLYKVGRINKLLMSGDNSRKRYSEPKVMKAYAMRLGVPAQDITLDYAGFNTYDSCYRARHIFGLRDATLVTQGYHLPRALMTCEGLGIRSTGVIAIRSSRDFTATYLLRELVSTDKAVIQNIWKPSPTVLGKPEVIH